MQVLSWMYGYVWRQPGIYLHDFPIGNLYLHGPWLTTSTPSTNFSSPSVFYTMSTYTPNGIYVTNQPHPKPVLGYEDSISTFPVQKRSLQNNDDDQHRQCKHGQTFPSEHRRRHNIRLRKLIFPALLVLLALCGLFAWSCVNWYG